MASNVGWIAGNYKKCIQDIDRINFDDLENPWTFFNLFSQTDTIVINWCVQQGLLLREVQCSHESCDGIMKLCQRSNKSCGFSLRCGRNRNHEKSVFCNTFFERSKLNIRDIFMFVKCYLDRLSLSQCAKFAGVTYGKTAVDWSSFIRELFKEYHYRHLRNKKLSGVIEIDESLFGRRVKYHRGNPRKGLRIWVFGMVERDSNSIILYPVTDRSEKTLLPLIKRHVAEGSTIYSDGWSAYCSLNEHGYEHFSVIHKHAFCKEYKNIDTGEIVKVHTNRIEGAWKHAKDHFRRMSGTTATQWEGHMAEVFVFRLSLYALINECLKL